MKMTRLAEELLKRIQAEKERLIKEKVIKKEKPLPEITRKKFLLIFLKIGSGQDWEKYIKIVSSKSGSSK